mmetsp:Transcript_66928/g.156948  ORF Transcript_66928/g.156948 Transcript_66928/m.156948 type:complete len:307 (+) Transcript_66928:439-1359(+)
MTTRLLSSSSRTTHCHHPWRYQSVLRAGFFKNKEHSYILAVVRVLEDKAFLPGDLVRVGEVADEMYFISKGEVSVLVAQGKSKDVEDAIQLPMRKREGDYFGEVALIKGSLRTAWIKAETYVVASCLRRSSIEQIWKYFPQERESLQKQVLQTVMRDAARQATSIRESIGGSAASQERSLPPSTGLGAAPATAADDAPAAVLLDASSLARIERLCESFQATQAQVLSRLEDLELHFESKLDLKAAKKPKLLEGEPAEAEAPAPRKVAKAAAKKKTRPDQPAAPTDLPGHSQGGAAASEIGRSLLQH